VLDVENTEKRAAWTEEERSAPGWTKKKMGDHWTQRFIRIITKR